MIGSLGIHAGDLRVVSVYEGSTIIDFEIIRNILDETPLDLQKVEEDFRVLASTADTFMGSTILGAAVETIAIITPNSPTGEAAVEEYKDIWDIDEDGNVVGVKTEKNVRVDIVYNDITVNYNKETARETTSYVVMIGLICIIILLISCAMCLFKKFLAKPDVRKAQNPMANLAHKSQVDSNEDDGQYVPNQLFDPKKSAFGGKAFDAKQSRSAKVGDDLLFTSKGKHATTAAGTDSKLNDSSEGALDHTRNASVSIPLKEGMADTVRDQALEEK